MRQLAKDLRVSIITTKRAYEELEKDGFINSIVGRGSFVAEQNIETMKEEKLKQLKKSYVKRFKMLSKWMFFK